MPSFATLSDDEIADVATYLRNSWGNHAPAASRSEVSALRHALATEPEVATIAQ
jgi:mono/diheme cytochrome c family protein